MTKEQRDPKEELTKIEKAIASYEELFADMDNPEYVARGNGFCDSKFSDDFIEGQLEHLRQEKTRLEQLILQSNKQTK